MARFKGPKPASQPRSLRSIAEAHSDAGNFPDSPPVNQTTTGGGPESIVGSAQYDDVAKAARPTPGAGQATSADPKPF